MLPSTPVSLPTPIPNRTFFHPRHIRAKTLTCMFPHPTHLFFFSFVHQHHVLNSNAPLPLYHTPSFLPSFFTPDNLNPYSSSYDTNPPPPHPPYTGNSAFRLAKPVRSITMPTYGPTTGTLRAKEAIVPRKSPKRTKMPYSSTQNPTSGQRSRISASPPKKAADPCSFWRRAKKTSVLVGPMMIARPMRKRICSMTTTIFIVHTGCYYYRY